MTGNPVVTKALSLIPYPVSVVTVGLGGAENGLTVSWLSQVSFDPPLVMIAVDRLHYSVKPLQASKVLVVNLLEKGQAKLAGHFAKQSMEGESKLAGFPTREAKSGGAILEVALAWLDCELVQEIPAGDHLLFIGKVIDAGVRGEGEPMTSAAGMRYKKRKE
jgi:flavin reductase (DIM6/NTAB) family NADH-FMN oxidoreductase RutF